jgi:hypothetical protein
MIVKEEKTTQENRSELRSQVHEKRDQRVINNAIDGIMDVVGEEGKKDLWATAKSLVGNRDVTDLMDRAVRHVAKTELAHIAVQKNNDDRIGIDALNLPEVIKRTMIDMARKNNSGTDARVSNWSGEIGQDSRKLLER